MIGPRDTTAGRTQGPGRHDRLREGERLIAILLAGLALLDYPLLSIFSKNSTVLGIPALYFYLFTSWCVVIAAVALVLGPRARDKGPQAPLSEGREP